MDVGLAELEMLVVLVVVVMMALTDDMAKTVAVSLIHSHIDYANSLIH